VVCTCHTSCSGGWGRRLTWVQEFKIILDNIVKTPIFKKKKRKKFWGTCYRMSFYLLCMVLQASQSHCGTFTVSMWHILDISIPTTDQKSQPQKRTLKSSYPFREWAGHTPQRYQ
jgi:hypothetical protein